MVKGLNIRIKKNPPIFNEIKATAVDRKGHAKADYRYDVNSWTGTKKRSR